MPNPTPNEHYKLLRQLGMLTFIPMILVSGPLAGFFLGKWLDFRFQTGQGLIILFVLLGFFAGAREAYRIIRKVGSEK